VCCFGFCKVVRSYTGTRVCSTVCTTVYVCTTYSYYITYITSHYTTLHPTIHTVQTSRSTFTFMDSARFGSDARTFTRITLHIHTPVTLHTLHYITLHYTLPHTPYKQAGQPSPSWTVHVLGLMHLRWVCPQAHASGQHPISRRRPEE